MIIASSRATLYHKVFFFFFFHFLNIQSALYSGREQSMQGKSRPVASKERVSVQKPLKTTKLLVLIKLYCPLFSGD